MPFKINKWHVIMCLREARDELERLILLAEHDELDFLDALEMGYRFKPVLENLCFAWHGKWMTDETFETLDDATVDVMRHSIPDWGLSFRLVDYDEPSEFDKRGKQP